MANADNRITLDDEDWLYDKIGITVSCFVETLFLSQLQVQGVGEVSSDRRYAIERAYEPLAFIFVENAIAALEILKYPICSIDDGIIVERPLYRSGSNQIVF